MICFNLRQCLPSTPIKQKQNIQNQSYQNVGLKKNRVFCGVFRKKNVKIVATFIS